VEDTLFHNLFESVDLDHYLRIVALLLTLSNITAQESQTTLAVLDFEPRGINTLEAATLTDRFTSEIGKTEAMVLVDRTMVEEILKEQGFQQSGCTTDECAVEVGAMLGVQFMISGAIGKLGDTFTIDAKMVSVESGASVETRNVTYIGKVDGLVTEIELLAWDIMNIEPPQELKEKKRLGAQAFLEASAAQKTRMGSLMRSTLLPGMGQFYPQIPSLLKI
jgi:TolB-like protein